MQAVAEWCQLKYESQIIVHESHIMEIMFSF